MVVCVATDRFISVCFPFIAKFLCTFRRAVVVCVTITLLQFLINLHFVWTSKLVLQKESLDKSEYLSQTPDEYVHFVTYIWPWVDLTNLFFLTAATLILLSTMIIHKITKQRRLVVPASSISGTSASTSQSHLTVSLIAICIAMVICNTPFVVICQQTWLSTGLVWLTVCVHF